MKSRLLKKAAERKFYISNSVVRISNPGDIGVVTNGKQNGSGNWTYQVSFDGDRKEVIREAELRGASSAEFRERDKRNKIR